MSEPSSRPSWLTPQFGWQLMSFVVVNIISVVVWGQLLKSDVRSLSEQMGTLRTTVQELRSAMPNQEVYNLRMNGFDKDLTAHDQRLRELEAYMQNVREKMAASGWRSIP